MKKYFYVNEAGHICDTETPIQGIGYGFEQKHTYLEIQLIVAETGEIVEQYVAWNSKEEIENALKETSTSTKIQKMEHIITLTESGTRTAFKELALDPLMQYIRSLVKENIAFTHTMEKA